MDPHEAATNRVKPIPIPHPQRSEGWIKGRLGKVTASKVSVTQLYSNPTVAQMNQATEVYRNNGFEEEDIEWLESLSKTEFCMRVGVDLAESATRKGYRENLVGERLTGLPSDPDQYVNYEMKWGMINEPLAIALYQMNNKCIVEDSLFLLHPTLKCGASPDGDVTDMTTGELGNAEVKSLRTANHLYKVVAKNEVPDDYIDQIQMQMWINGRDWCDFIADDPRVPDGLKQVVIRVPYDPLYLELVLLPNLFRFLDECDRDFKHFWAMVTERGKKEFKGEKEVIDV